MLWETTRLGGGRWQCFEMREAGRWFQTPRGETKQGTWACEFGRERGLLIFGESEHNYLS